MALFEKKNAAQDSVADEPVGVGKPLGNEVDSDDYFAGMEGAGLEELTGAALSTAYLAMVQPGSGPTLSGHEAGTWRNSATDENFGTSVKVIPMAFKTVWTERNRESPFETVGRYEPHSIEVNIVPPKPGTRGFPKMTNPKTGNEVQELFIYAVVQADNPSAGVLYFSPTAGSMRACKNWNSQLRSQRLPNGKLAPIFGFEWTLDLDLVTNPTKPAEKIAKFVRATRGALVEKDTFVSYVQPQLTVAQNITLLAAPEQSGDAIVEE
jgi:hypothetical protein